MFSKRSLNMSLASTCSEVAVRRSDGILITITLNPGAIVPSSAGALLPPSPSQIPLPATPTKKKVKFLDTELTAKEKEELDQEDCVFLYGIAKTKAKMSKMAVRTSRSMIERFRSGQMQIEETQIKQAVVKMKSKIGKRVTFAEVKSSAGEPAFDDW